MELEGFGRTVSSTVFAGGEADTSAQTLLLASEQGPGLVRDVL